MIMSTKRNSSWTKAAVVDALNARGVYVSKNDITINATAKDLAWAKEEAWREYRGGVFCIAGFGGIPDAVVYAEREPYDDALPYVTHIMIRSGRVSTFLIDEIADAIF